MDTNDLSLFGFLDEDDADSYLRTYCILDPAPDTRSMWQDARSRLGDPIAKAGEPEISDMPWGQKGYLRELQKQERFQDTVRGLDWSFKCVEIDPLIAFQIHIEGVRSDSLGTGLPDKCTTKELVPVCLPSRQERIEPTITDETPGERAGVFALEAPTRNLLYLSTGAHETGVQDRYVVGSLIGLAPPFVQVIRHEGVCYLTNGYHRVLSASKKGATHIPCIFGDTESFGRTGAAQDGSLPAHLFKGDHRPTVGHYTRGRAAPVRLRRFATKISVSWEVSYPEIG